MKVDFALDYDVLTVERPQKVYLMARLFSGPSPENSQRRPLNISLVLDRSGSMAGDKIEYTRQAAQFLIQHLSAKDIFSLVIYNENVETLVTSEPVLHKDSIAQRLKQIKASGMTNLSGGWLQGCGLIEQSAQGEMLNRVILMTDGLANRGITRQEQLVNLARQKRDEQIITTTMGLGVDFNEDLLMAMAEAGGGAFYFIESPESTPLIFQEELRDLLSVVGQNLTVTLQTTEHVTGVSQLNAYNMHTDGRAYSFTLGDVYGDEIKTLVLELSIPGLHEAGECEIARLRFDYDVVNEQRSEHQSFELPVTIRVANADDLASEPNAEVQGSVLLLQAAKARREAVSAADRGNFDSASQILKQAAGRINDSQINIPELLDEARALSQQATEMERGHDFYDSYNRKSMSTQAIYTLTDRHEATQNLRAREIEQALHKPTVDRKPGVAPTALTWREQTLPLDTDLIRIGRAPQNEMVLDAKNISRFHCQIKRDGELLILEDLGSTNGTFVNEMLIREPHVLCVGDVARVGYEQLIFHNHT